MVDEGPVDGWADLSADMAKGLRAWRQGHPRATLDFQNQEVTMNGKRVNLTPIEFKLLYYLVRNAGRVLPQQTLLNRVWGEDYDATSDYLKVYISRLRAKLEREGGSHYIETVRGLGYRFIRPKEAAGRP